MTYAHFRERFALGMDTRFYTIEHLDWLVMTGRAKFWCSEDAAIVAEIKYFPTGAMAVCGVIAAGEAAGIEALIPLAEQWGQKCGCAFGMIESREAWGKIMKKHGYAPFQTAIVKEL